MTISGLGYFALDTAESQKWHELLSEVLGMAAEAADGVTFYRLDEWHHRIAVYDAEVESIRAVGWQLEDESSLDEMAEEGQVACPRHVPAERILQRVGVLRPAQRVVLIAPGLDVRGRQLLKRLAPALGHPVGRAQLLREQARPAERRAASARGERPSAISLPE